MSRKHNYPINRKSTKSEICPVCGLTFKARGIVNHVKLKHGVKYVEIQKTDKISPQPQVETGKHLDEVLAELLNELVVANRGRQVHEYSSIVHEIAKLRARMGWPPNDIAAESDAYMRKCPMVEAQDSTPPLQKRLVVMFEDNSHREMNFSDYADVLQWLDQLQQVKEEFKARISRYKDVPALMDIEKRLSGI